MDLFNQAITTTNRTIQDQAKEHYLKILTYHKASADINLNLISQSISIEIRF